MKTKLNLTIEEELVPMCKEYARSKGMSVSQLVEQLLRSVAQKERPSFSSRWRGKFKVAEKSNPRFEKLKERYLA